MYPIKYLLSLLCAIILCTSYSIDVLATNEPLGAIKEELTQYKNNKSSSDKKQGWYKYNEDYYYYDLENKENLTGVQVFNNTQYLFDENGKFIENISKNGFVLIDYQPPTSLDELDFGKHQEFAQKIFDWLSSTDYDWWTFYRETFKNKNEADDFFDKFNKQVIKNPQFYLEYSWYGSSREVIVELTEKWRSYIPCYLKLVEILNTIAVEQHFTTVKEVIEAVIQYSITEMKYSWNYEKNGLHNALFENETICGGFSTYFEYAVSLFGFETDWVYGYCDTNIDSNYHAWNRLIYDDTFYYFDLTYANNDYVWYRGSPNKYIEKYGWATDDFENRVILNLW